MFKKLALLLIFIAGFYIVAKDVYAQEEAVTFSKEDRVLILAPHPDDEAIATAGAIQQALKAGASVKVVCLTNGDNNELSFIVYEKRLTVKKREFLHMGEVRVKETVNAMEFLGLSRSDIIFLGYPDFGTMRILVEYWGDTKPYKSWLTRVNKVIYPDAMSLNAPYVGESILKDLKTILLGFKPTKIFVSYPADVNRDHRALYVYTKVALLDLEGKIKQPQVYPYLVHAIRWPLPRGYHPDLQFDPPQNFKDSGIQWQRLELSDDEIDTKYKAIKLYKSQIPYAPSYLVTFARENEFFGDFPAVELKSQDPQQEIFWQELKSPEELNEDEEDGGEGSVIVKNHLISTVAFARQGGFLWVKLDLTKNIEKNLGVTLFIFGYKKGRDFGQMPKIQVPINMLGLHLKDKKKMLSVKKIKYKNKGKMWTLGIPLSLLGDPDNVFSYVRAHSRSLPIETTAWRILELQ
jgi:LmbE family N-acetylglucosaminyl deacetylase